VESRYRGPLYDFRNPFQTARACLNQEQGKEPSGVHRRSYNPSSGFPFDSCAEGLDLEVDESSEVRLRWWLKKTPTLLQRKLGSSAAPSLACHTT
jgi:hypothetical protein